MPGMVNKICFKHIYSTFQSISVQTDQSLMLIDFNFAKIWKHPDRPPLTAFACSTASWVQVKTHLVRTGHKLTISTVETTYHTPAHCLPLSLTTTDPLQTESLGSGDELCNDHLNFLHSGWVWDWISFAAWGEGCQDYHTTALGRHKAWKVGDLDTCALDSLAAYTVLLMVHTALHEGAYYPCKAEVQMVSFPLVVVPSVMAGGRAAIP